MDSVIKTILYSYPHFKRLAESLEQTAYKKALDSHCNAYKTFDQVQEVMQLYEDAKFIRRLRAFTNQILKELSDPELQLVKFKYFKIKSGVILPKCKRTYFRHQVKLDKKLKELAFSFGLDEKWFFTNCYRICALRSVYNKLLEKSAEKSDIAKKTCVKMQKTANRRLQLFEEKKAA